MLDLQKLGSVTFDYGQQHPHFAFEQGVTDAYDFPGSPRVHSPAFCEGRGPFRWVALSGEPSDIYRTDQLVLEMFPQNEMLTRWIRLAAKSACASRDCPREFAGSATASAQSSPALFSRRGNKKAIVMAANPSSTKQAYIGAAIAHNQPWETSITHVQNDASDAVRRPWPFWNSHKSRAHSLCAKTEPKVTSASRSYIPWRRPAARVPIRRMRGKSNRRPTARRRWPPASETRPHQ